MAEITFAPVAERASERTADSGSSVEAKVGGEQEKASSVGEGASSEAAFELLEPRK